MTKSAHSTHATDIEISATTPTRQVQTSLEAARRALRDLLMTPNFVSATALADASLHVRRLAEEFERRNSPSAASGSGRHPVRAHHDGQAGRYMLSNTARPDARSILVNYR